MCSIYKIYNNKWSPNARWERITHISPSNYIRKGTLHVLRQLRTQFPDDYLVCIGYRRGDTQVGLTETFKTYEQSPNTVLDRCLREETCVERFKKEPTSSAFLYHERYASIYCMPLRVTSSDHLRPLYTDPHMIPDVMEEDLDKEDDKSRKLVLLVHGSLPQLLEQFSRFASSERDIEHLILVPLRGISTCFPNLFLTFPLIPSFPRVPPPSTPSHSSARYICSTKT